MTVTVALLLRVTAVAIAVAGMVDPSFTFERPLPGSLTIAVLHDEDTSESVRPSTARDIALGAAERLRHALAPGIAATIRIASPSQQSAACLAASPCVIVAGASGQQRLMGAGATLAGVVHVDTPPFSAPIIERIEAPPQHHPSAAGLMRVHVANAGSGTLQVHVLDGDAIVGETASSGQNARTSIDVQWWPLSSGPRRLTVRVARSAASATTSPERERPVVEAVVGVNVRPATSEVIVYDSRPSWASTFVRRALERDPRLSVRARSNVAPALSVSSGPSVRLDASTLTRASVAIVGAPEGLSPTDVDVLERFVRVRAGTLVLLPDRSLSGPVTRLAPRDLRERLEREAVSVGPLRASELLVPGATPTLSRVLASMDDGTPIVVAVPAGEGRVIVSGALDAWRYRGENEAAFDAFWRSLVAEAASLGGRPLEVVAEPRVPAPGESVHVEVTRRSLRAPVENVRIGVTVTCEGQPQRVIRVWPSSRDRFEGAFTAAAPGPCELQAEASGDEREEATAAIVVAAAPPRSMRPDSFSSVQRLVGAYGALEIRAGDEAALAASLLGRIARPIGPVAVHPMRSPWWIVPFVICLGAEWWHRRRKGLR
ncbi:MAG: hypothetical protein LC791_14590 [Acidobacteria bacterium]|nr:hypothetical protein [Acidobacteriota bacterium]